jgi:hypothetical protein
MHYTTLLHFLKLLKGEMSLCWRSIHSYQFILSNYLLCLHWLQGLCGSKICSVLFVMFDCSISFQHYPFIVQKWDIITFQAWLLHFAKAAGIIPVEHISVYFICVMLSIFWLCLRILWLVTRVNPINRKLSVKVNEGSQ